MPIVVLSNAKEKYDRYKIKHIIKRKDRILTEIVEASYIRHTQRRIW